MNHPMRATEGLHSNHEYEMRIHSEEEDIKKSPSNNKEKRDSKFERVKKS